MLKLRSLLKLSNARNVSLGSRGNPVGKLKYSTPSNRPTTKAYNESFMNGTNAVSMETLYESWKANPNSVASNWSTYFQSMDMEPPASVSLPNGVLSSQLGGASEKDIWLHIHLMLLIRNYRVRGHLLADIDPLGLAKRNLNLDIHNFGFTPEDLDKEFIPGDLLLPNLRSNGKATLREIVAHLKKCYTGKCGFEYYHIADVNQRKFMRERVENGHFCETDEVSLKRIYKYMMKAELFEDFLSNKFPNTKRFGLEGGESLIPGLNEIVGMAMDDKVENILIGMSHRGRLNVVTNVLRRKLRSLLQDFDPKWASDLDGTGDVKYHLGANEWRVRSSTGQKIFLSMASNPSHLEAVDPVVVGKVRAKQHFSDDHDRKKTFGILIHGDASFIGQGIVAETLSMSDLKFYETGGTIHIIVNNQIGFTTDPFSARSSPHPSDVAKMVGAPILHVNGDDPVAVANIFKLAYEFRMTFKKDVVVDMVCYRRHGHNEQDDPSFTQPQMYEIIRSKPTTATMFEEQLLKEKKISKEEVDETKASIKKLFLDEFEASKTYEKSPTEWLEANWAAFKVKDTNVPTGVALDTLKQLGEKIFTVPAGFAIHRLIGRLYHERKEAVCKTGENLDWGAAEALAYASLVNESYHVRLSGQDVERGTFGHRHSVIHDQSNYGIYIPLDHVSPEQGTFRVCNSSLSEYGVLGYELGYSLEHPNLLVIWEAQFGDFANGAQVIFDQFISNGEKKWHRQSGLTCLLPHGYDGNGPEHSSGRVERWLQLVDENQYDIPKDVDKQQKNINIQVCNASTPANFFHLLRRQVLRNYRKPLIVMTPKNLLFHRFCRSKLEEMKQGTSFLRVIPDMDPTLKNVKKVVFCSGQIYYAVWDKRNSLGLKDVAIVRLEQIAPFPYDLVMKELQKYPGADVLWVQEEHMNMGCWSFVDPRFETCFKALGLKSSRIRYVGREPAAAPATGMKKLHEKQHEILLHNTFSDEVKPNPSNNSK